jgi:tetratricopeptide (TPR) repeat protein
MNPTGSTNRQNRELKVALLLAVGTVAVFARACGNDFVNYDDFPYVTQNANVRAGLTLKSIWWALTSTELANWHPLTWLSLQLDAQLFGLDPWGFHLTNVLLHAANVCLLFAFLQATTGALWSSAIAAALFAVHPLHVESVAWVAERKDVLSTFFWLLTMLAYARYARQPGPGRFALVMASYGLGLMAKPMLVTLACVLLLLDYWPLGRTGVVQSPKSDIGHWTLDIGLLQHSLPRLLVEKIPLFAMAAASCAITLWAQSSGGTVSSLNQLPLSLRAQVALVGYAGYLAKMVWPWALAPLYPLPTETLPIWQLAGAAGLLVGVTTATLVLRRRCPYLAVGWFWYLGTLVPVIGLVQVGLQASADRYTYVPLIGIFIAIAWGGADLVARLALPRLLLACAVGLALAACAALTWVQLGYWRDSMSLWTHSLEVTPNNYVAYNNLGYVLALADDEESNAEALEYFQKTLRLNRNFADGNNNLGHALAREGKLQEAIEFYTRALEINPEYAQAHNNLGLALARVGRDEEAASHFKQAFAIMPSYSMAHNNLGKLLAQQGKIPAARAELEKALELNPENADAHTNLGVLFQGEGKLREALEQYQTAVRVEPKNADAHNNLGMMLAGQGKRDLALAHFKLAVKNNPKLASARYNLGVALAEQGQRQEAKEQYEKGLRLEPSDVQIRNNLAWELLQEGQWEAAKKHLLEAVRLEPKFALAHDNLGIVLAIQGNAEQALRSFEEAVRLEPRIARFHADLAHALSNKGDTKGSKEHYQEALRLDPNWPPTFARRARELASRPNGEDRNSALALWLALAACEATGYEGAQFLDTLAMAYAEAGRFQEAQATARRALDKSSQNPSLDTAGIQNRLRLYEASKPYREP